MRLLLLHLRCAVLLLRSAVLVVLRSPGSAHLRLPVGLLLKRPAPPTPK